MQALHRCNSVRHRWFANRACQCGSTRDHDTATHSAMRYSVPYCSGNGHIRSHHYRFLRCWSSRFGSRAGMVRCSLVHTGSHHRCSDRTARCRENPDTYCRTGNRNTLPYHRYPGYCNADHRLNRVNTRCWGKIRLLAILDILL